MKLFYLDLETTGVRYWKNGIHQISGAIEINGEVKETFNYNVRPFHKALIEDEALTIAGITRDDLEDYADFKDVYDDIILRLSRYVDKYNRKDKFYIVGFNSAGFDNPFFRAFFVQNGDEYFGSWFWSVPIDVIVLAAQYLKDKRVEMKDFKLKTVAAFLGITVDESRLHDAIYDIELTREIYKIVSANPWNALEKMGSPDKWLKVYSHYSELLTADDTANFWHEQFVIADKERNELKFRLEGLEK
jgi:DNA polymerase-3 subunit epsilon